MLSFLKQSNKNLYDLTLKLILITVIASIFSLCSVAYHRSIGYVFLIWNIFLAWLPLYFSLVFTNYKFRVSFFKYAVGLLWFIFYPNAPYMVTDFIHLSRYKFYQSKPYVIPFSTNISIWYDFFLISIFVIISLVLSFISLSIMHKLIKEKYNSIWGWSFIFIICILSGFGIYLGRFIRVNSWDVVTNPLHLLNIIFNSLNFQGLIFTLLFSVLILMSYLTFSVMNTYHS